MTMVCYHIRVTGKVQGVFYRASTRERAQQLGLSGWVRNESDGSVSLHAEGARSDLETLMDWCRQGPAHAHVDSVDVEEIPLQQYAGFEVRY